jgi:hypothetical protein
MPYRVGDGPRIKDVFKANNVYANNVLVALWQPPGEVIDGVYIPDDPYQFFHAETILTEAGSNAPNDDPASPVVEYPPAGSEPPSIEIPTEVPGQPQVSSGAAVQCGNFTVNPIDYNQKLSTNYSLRNVSIGTQFPHQIVAQNGLTVSDIICNLKAVAENIIEPLARKYPGFQINSGFRKGTSSSQHNRGQAVDIQWPGISAAEYTVRAQWVKSNLPFDQFIFEHGNSIWFHLSYNRSLTRQRNSLLTYYPKASPQYKSGITNYYA